MGKEIMVVIMAIGLFAAVVLSIFFIMKYRSITPLQTIDINAGQKRKSDWQKPGIVVFGIGLGVLITGLLSDYSNIDNEAINLGIIAICAGIAMIIANVLDKDQPTED